MNGRIVTLAALAVAAVGTLTGCSDTAAGPAITCSVTQCPGTVYVVGAHRNEPAPALTSQMESRLAAAITAGRSVGAVTVEGTPRIVVPAQVMPIRGTTGLQRATSVAQDTAAVEATLAGAKATSPGADLLTSLQRAAEAARSAVPAATQLVVLDDGLTDRGAVDFTSPGMASADPAEVAQFLLTRGEITRTSFRGLTVRFVGLGATVAPQPALGEPQRRRLAAIWSAIVVAGDGTAVVDETPRTGKAARTPFMTRTVPVQPAPKWVGTGPLLLTDAAVGFVAGTDRFREPEEARRVLAPVARWLAANPGRFVTVTGRTSSEPVTTGPDDRALSLMRAKAVAALLGEGGAAPEQLRSVGAGYTAQPDDTTASGAIDPAKAAQNRAVVLAPIG